MATYNGHKNYAHWSQSLWINNDERLYLMAKQAVRTSSNKIEATKSLKQEFEDLGMYKTPDGVKWSLSGIRAALFDM